MSVAVSASGAVERGRSGRAGASGAGTPASTSSTPSAATAGRRSRSCRPQRELEVDAGGSSSRAAAGAARSRGAGAEREVPARSRRGRRPAAPRRGPRPCRRTTRSTARGLACARLVVLLGGARGRSPRSWPPRRARCRGARPGRTPTSPGSSARGARRSDHATATAKPLRRSGELLDEVDRRRRGGRVHAASWHRRHAAAGRRARQGS